MPDKDYTVFTCDPAAHLAITGDEEDGSDDVMQVADEWWRAHGPITAKSEPAAIEALMDADPDLKGNADVLYHAVANFRPRKMIRQITVRHALGYADEDQPTDDDAQGTLS